MINTKNKWAKCFLLKRLEKVNTQMKKNEAHRSVRWKQKWGSTKLNAACLLGASVSIDFFQRFIKGKKTKFLEEKDNYN